LNIGFEAGLSPSLSRQRAKPPDRSRLVTMIATASRHQRMHVDECLTGAQFRRDIESFVLREAVAALQNYFHHQNGQY
jgi:hypothetical protein